jgi:hypothetical protein
MDILFGIVPNTFNDKMIETLNFCIIEGKWYIAKEKYVLNDCNFIKFLCELKNRINIEKYIITTMKDNEDLFERKWGLIYN